MAILCAALGAAAFGISLARGLQGKFDFSHFYRDAHYTWTHHGELNPALTGPEDAQRQLPFYLPAVTLWLAPLAAAGEYPAAFVWALLQGLALAGSWRMLWDWTAECDPQRRRIAFITITVLALPALFEAAKFNQLTFPVLFALLSASRALISGKMLLGGVWLAIGGFLKLLPVVFLAWLVPAGRIRTTVAFALSVAFLALVPALVVWGPRQAGDYYTQWWQLNAGGPPASGMVSEGTPLREHFTDHRNQSIASILAHWFSPTHPHRLHWQPAQLSEEQCAQIARLVSALLLLGLAAVSYLTRRAPGAAAIERSVALCMVAMLVLSPLLRQYYLAWAVPGLACAARAWAHPVPDMSRRLPGAILAIWAAAMAAWLSDTLRLAGVHLFALLLMFLLLAVLHMRQTRMEIRLSAEKSLSEASAGG